MKKQEDMPPELAGMAMAGNPGIGPFGFERGQYAENWRVVIDGRHFKLARWFNERDEYTSYMYVELEWARFNHYSHIPGMENCSPEWGWRGINSRHEYLPKAAK